MTGHAPAEIRMINSIATHLGYLPSDQAATAVADHIKRFWDPRMKRQLLLHVAIDTEALNPVALAATTQL